MRQITIVLIFAKLLSSCVCLKNNNNSERIILTESNFTLINGRYERKSTQLDKYSFPIGDLYWNFFQNVQWEIFSNYDESRGLNHKSDSDFFELEIIDKNKILVSYIDDTDTLKSKILKCKIKNGYFVFRKRYLFIPMVFTNLYRNSQFRIGLSNDNNLRGDFKQLSFGTFLILFPFYEKINESDMEYKRLKCSWQN